jgi:hypothetical protein
VLYVYICSCAPAIRAVLLPAAAAAVHNVAAVNHKPGSVLK